MRHGFVDQELLQRVRLELAANRGDGTPEFAGLPDIGPDKLKLHLERLFYSGELSAEARIDSAGLHLKPLRLTPYGVLAMHARLSRARRAA